MTCTEVVSLVFVLVVISVAAAAVEPAIVYVSAGDSEMFARLFKHTQTHLHSHALTADN